MTHLTFFEQDCRWFAALTSFILTLLLGWNALINSDGILYVTQAHLMSEGAWREALAHYPWPAYAALIAGVHALGFSFDHAAVLINASFYALLITGFVTVIQQAGGNRSIQWLAALVMLIYPSINDYREYIIRDVGLWGMLFWGIYALSRFHAQRAWRDIILWTLTMSVAFLFRVEAIVFMVLAPFGLLILKPRRSMIDLLRFQSLFIIMGAAVGVYASITDKMVWLGRIHELPVYFHEMMRLSDTYMQRAEGLSQVFSHELKIKHGAIALFGALVTYLIYMWAKVVTPLYVLLGSITVSQRLFTHSLTKRYVYLFIGIAALIVLTFFLKMYFLSSRYVVPLALLCLTFVPFAIHHIAASRGNGSFLGKPWMFPLMVLLLITLFVSGVTSFGYSKEYLREAGVWIQQHAKPDAHIYINEKHVAYYAQRFEAFEETDAEMKRDFSGKDIVALYHEKDTPEVTEYIAQHFGQYEKVTFENKRHDGVTIIVVNKESVIQ